MPSKEILVNGGGGTGGTTGGTAVDNNVNNRVTTATGGSSINGEPNLLFDGNKLTVIGIIGQTRVKTGAANLVQEYHTPDLATNEFNEIAIGRDPNPKNRASMIYRYQGSNSNNNSFGVAFFGTPEYFQVYADGGVLVWSLASSRGAPSSTGNLNQVLADATGKLTTIPVYTTQEHVTGNAVTIGARTGWLVVNPATVLSSLTLGFPATPVDGQEFVITFGGSITTGVVVSSLVIGPAVIQHTAPTEIVAGDVLRYKYRGGTTQKWYRL